MDNSLQSFNQTFPSFPQINSQYQPNQTHNVQQFPSNHFNQTYEEQNYNLNPDINFNPNLEFNPNINNQQFINDYNINNSSNNFNANNNLPNPIDMNYQQKIMQNNSFPTQTGSYQRTFNQTPTQRFNQISNQVPTQIAVQNINSVKTIFYQKIPVIINSIKLLSYSFIRAIMELKNSPVPTIGEMNYKNEEEKKMARFIGCLVNVSKYVDSCYKKGEKDSRIMLNQKIIEPFLNVFFEEFPKYYKRSLINPAADNHTLMIDPKNLQIYHSLFSACKDIFLPCIFSFDNISLNSMLQFSYEFIRIILEEFFEINATDRSLKYMPIYSKILKNSESIFKLNFDTFKSDRITDQYTKEIIHIFNTIQNGMRKAASNSINSIFYWIPSSYSNIMVQNQLDLLSRNFGQ